MKKRIYLILLFMFFFIIFDRGGAYLFRELNYSFYSSNQMKKNSFGKPRLVKKGFYDSMIFGSSRTVQSIHPEYLFKDLGLKALCEAKNDRYPEYFYRFYRRFKNSYGIPKYVFYGVDYFLFKKRTIKQALWNLSERKRLARRINFRKRLNKNSKFLSHISLLFRVKDKIDKTSESYLYKMSMEWDIVDKKNTEVAGISNFLGKKKVLKAKLRIKPATWEKFPYINSENGEGPYLKLLFDELEKDGVKVFVVGIPSYIGSYESNYEQDKFSSDIRNLIRRRERFWFFNYNHPDKFDLGNYEYFTDGGYGYENSHISYLGGIPFNKLLVEDVRNLIDK